MQMGGNELLAFMAESMSHRRLATRIIGRMKDLLHLSPDENTILAEDDEISLVSYCITDEPKGEMLLI